MGLVLLTPPRDASSARIATFVTSPTPIAEPNGMSPLSCSVTNPQTSATAISLATPTIVFNGSSQGYEMVTGHP